MATIHSVHAMMVGMSESWWRSGIMPCLRSDVDRDKPVAYIFWLIEGPNGPIVVDTGYHPDYVAPEWAQGKQFIEPPKLLADPLGERHELEVDGDRLLGVDGEDDLHGAARVVPAGSAGRRRV